MRKRSFLLFLLWVVAAAGLMVSQLSRQGYDVLALMSGTFSSKIPVTGGQTPVNLPYAILQETIQQSHVVPEYFIVVSYPVLQENTPDSAEYRFNQAIVTQVQSWVKAYESQPMPQKPSANGSQSSSGYLTVTYSILSSSEHFLSVYFQVYQLVPGDDSAHNTSWVYNYNLAEDRPVSLTELFKPGNAYLLVLSDYVSSQLDGKLLFFKQEGVDPAVTNFRNWNVTPDGLRFTFDPGQVAPAIFGYYSVTVPYPVLKSVLAAGGPLDNILAEQ